MISASISHSKVLGANMGPIWDRKDLGGPHVGHTNLAIWDIFVEKVYGEDQSVVYRMFWSLLHTLFFIFDSQLYGQFHSCGKLLEATSSQWRKFTLRNRIQTLWPISGPPTRHAHYVIVRTGRNWSICIHLFNPTHASGCLWIWSVWGT